jgi:hypothetical protein
MVLQVYTAESIYSEQDFTAPHRQIVVRLYINLGIDASPVTPHHRLCQGRSMRHRRMLLQPYVATALDHLRQYRPGHPSQVCTSPSAQGRAHIAPGHHRWQTSTSTNFTMSSPPPLMVLVNANKIFFFSY